ncbi:MAG: CgeB family protein [Cellulosilyticaceae bacterium]
MENKQTRSIQEFKIACILDEFSYNCLKYECNLLPIEPANWQQVFEQEAPDLFFCESAWSGVDSVRRPWKGQVYGSCRFPKENRTALLGILAYCKKKCIPTVFWNKEDPSYYTDKVHNFVDTAIKFDHIFTTAEECVDKYKEEYGHLSVHTLMFAAQPKMFNPIEKYIRTDEVIFAGSWYTYHRERCIEMEQIFDSIIASGKLLKIYNRYSGDTDSNHIFPEKYASYIFPALRYESLDQAYKGSRYALNITTVTESNTMFSRRIFELMASNTLVITNASKGIKKWFQDNVVYTDGSLAIENIEEKCTRNLYEVLENHTYTKRLEEILDKIHMSYNKKLEKIAIYYIINNEKDMEAAVRNYEMIGYPYKMCIWLVSEKIPDVRIQQIVEVSRGKRTIIALSYIKRYGKMIENDADYFIIAHEDCDIEMLIKGKVHYTYLSEDVAIAKGKCKYTVSEVDGIENQLFQASQQKSMLEKMIIQQEVIKHKVYYI